MSLSSNSVFIPGRGTVLLADVDTPAPDYKTIDPTNLTASEWSALGHTSRDNAVKLTKDGGDSSTVGSWWEEALVVTREGITWGLEAFSLQIDKDTLSVAFGGGEHDTEDGGYFVPSQITGVEKAAFILAIDAAGKRMGVWIPRVSITLGDAPEFDPTKFLEVPLTGAVLASETVKTSAAAGAKSVVFKWFHPALDPIPAG